MIRDHLVVPLSPGFAAPLDLPVTREDRAASLRDHVPSHTVVSGLGGLWIHMGGVRPTYLDLVGARGLHRAPPGTHPFGWIVRFHSGRAATEPPETIADVRVASPARCVTDGLRWGDLAQAIPATIRAIRCGYVTRWEVASKVRAEDPRGLGAARLRSAWAAIDRVLS
jgi:hypothetical protein